jgi:hypothetical protein
MWHVGGKNAYRVLVGKREERDRLEDKGVDGRIIFECTLNKSVGRAWTGLIWYRIGTSGELL